MIDALVIRPEQECNFDEIREVVKTAFAGAEHTDGDEHNLIDRLRLTEEYIPDLSLIAEVDGRIVGYAMFSRICIGNTKAVALASLAVHPAFQNRGIGRRSHRGRTSKSERRRLLLLGSTGGARILFQERLSSGIDLWNNCTVRHTAAILYGLSLQVRLAAWHRGIFAGIRPVKRHEKTDSMKK